MEYLIIGLLGLVLITVITLIIVIVTKKDNSPTLN